MMYIDNEVLEKMIMTIVEGFDRIEKKLDRMGRVKEFLNGDELLDNYDIARLLNVSLRTVARYREKGLIRYYQTDENGKEYIDFFCGSGALNYGHNNPYIKEKVVEYLQNDGVMHACGHDGHCAMLVGAAQILSADRDFAGTVVLVFQPAGEHPGDDLHVAVRVGVKTAARSDDVVVVDQQQSVVGVGRVVVVAERERMPGVQPVDGGPEPVVGAPDVDHQGSLCRGPLLGGTTWFVGWRPWISTEQVQS